MTHTKLFAVCAVLALVALAGCGSILGGQGTTATGPATDTSPSDGSTLTDTPDESGSTPTPTPTPTSTPTPTPTPTQTPTPTPTSTPAQTPTPTPGPTPTPTPTDGPSNDVELRGTLSVDEDEVYAQVERLLGREARPPTVIVVDTIPSMKGPEPRWATPFRTTFGYGREYIDASVYHGYTAPDRGRIVVSPRNASRAEVETLLAHEYTHWLQFTGESLVPESFGSTLGESDTDTRQVRLGLVEGASVYLTDRYVAEYMNVSWNQTTALETQYEAGPPARRYFRARYLFGAQYVHSTVDDPANLSSIYQPSWPAPKTSEQLIHRYTPSEEPERNLTVSAVAGGNWSVTGTDYDTKGEVVVRTTLRVELNESVAAPAAAGWGTDEVVRFSHAGNRSRRGFAWALRWDSPADAEEFVAAFERWTAARPAADATAFRQVRGTEETVVVFAGDPAFVRNASVSATTGNVTVAAPAAGG